MKTWDEAFKFKIWSRRCWNQIIQLENRWDGKNVRQAAWDGVPSRKEIYMYLQLIGGKFFYYTCVGCVFRGLTDESEIIKFLQHGTLVGLLPVPHPILIRKYQVKISSVMLLQMFKEYLQNFTIFSSSFKNNCLDFVHMHLATYQNELFSIFVLLTLSCLRSAMFTQYRVANLPTYPSPNPTFCPKWDANVNVELEEG